MSLAESKVRQAVREGVARMQDRRQAERKLAEVARECPEMAAREMLLFARAERDRLRRQLLETFGFSISREHSGFRCRFAAPVRRPKTLEVAATWLDAVVALAGFDIALDGMWLAAAYFPPQDRARKICDAFADVMRETPAVYAAFANCQEEYAPGVREYAGAMLAAWARSHLKSYPKTKAALEGPNWETELVYAALRAWKVLGPDSPIKRGTRFRDTLPKQKDGRRQRAPDPADFVNLVDGVLASRDSVRKAESPELEFAGFAEREAEALLKRGRADGLPPREYQYLKLWAQNPRISYSEAARELKISEGAVKTLKHRVMNTLRAS